MNRIKQFVTVNRELVVTVLMAVFFLVGLAGHLVGRFRPLMLALSPYFLFVFGVFALYPTVRQGSWKLRFWMIGTLLITFGLEAAGTATGAIFGPYTYGPTLGFSLLDVPVVIAFNWLIVILGAHGISKRIFKNDILSALGTGAFALFFDFVLEPVAIALHYWNWHADGIPLQNYAAWFLIAAAAAYVYNKLQLGVPNQRLRNYVLIQLVFFTVLRLAL